MSDKPKTIDHDPNEPHRFEPRRGVHFDPKEPIFGANAGDFILHVVVTIIVVYLLYFPLNWFAEKVTCSIPNLCDATEAPSGAQHPASRQ